MFGRKKKDNKNNNQSPTVKSDKNKRIDLDTLEMKSKKKKTIIIASVFGVFIVVMIVAIINAFLSVDHKKVYKERKKISLKKDLEVIQNPEYKENWAISVENKLSEQDKKISKINNNINNLKEDILNSIKTALNENNVKINKKIDIMSQNVQEKVNEVRESFNSEIQKINKKVEQLQLEIAAVKNAQQKNIESPNNNLIVGPDLLPLKKKGDNQKNKEDLTIIVQQEENKAVQEAEKKVSEKKETSTKITEETNNNLITNQKKVTPIKKTQPKIVKSLKKNIKVEDIDTSFNAKIIQNIQQIQQEEAKKESKEKPTWHVSVGFAKAYMITGAYAPTFQNASSEPLPVLLEADGNILMANNVEGSIEKCFLLGSAKGNMNSQTVNIKLVSINCLLDGGKYRIEGPISGWVIGENGVPGIHGELLHKNGAWIARTFVAGFLQTFSQAVSGTQVQPIVVGGTTDNQQTTSTGSAISTNIAAAAGQGLSNVFGKLGEYYLKMAEQIFPVIEVKPGRTVSIMLMGGEDLTLVKNNPVDIRQMEEYIEEQLAKEKASQESKKISGNAFTRTIIQQGNNGNTNTADQKDNSKYIEVNGKKIKVPTGN